MNIFQLFVDLIKNRECENTLDFCYRIFTFQRLFKSCRLICSADKIAVRIKIHTLHKLRINPALTLYRHAYALVVEHPYIVVPGRRVFLAKYGRLIQTAKLRSALGSVQQIALAGIEQLIIIMVAVLLLYLSFDIFF